MSGLVYNLLKNPLQLQKLQKEVGGAFSRSEEMTVTALSQLPYPNVYIDEGLRIYPPVAGPLSRVAPKGGAMVRGNFIPERSVINAPHIFVQFRSNIT